MRSGRWLPESRRSRASLLAGWLFADLCLVLFLVNLASAPPKPSVKAYHPPTATPTPSPTPTKAKPAAKPRALQQYPVTITITNITATDITAQAGGGPLGAQLIRELSAKLAAHHLQQRQAGFVLVYASAPEAEIGQALTSASAALGIIKSKDGKVFSDAAGEGLWNGSGNGFEFQIFFFE
jgi:hypothetical protein